MRLASLIIFCLTVALSPIRSVGQNSQILAGAYSQQQDYFGEHFDVLGKHLVGVSVLNRTQPVISLHVRSDNDNSWSLADSLLLPALPYPFEFNVASTSTHFVAGVQSLNQPIGSYIILVSTQGDSLQILDRLDYPVRFSSVKADKDRLLTQMQSVFGATQFLLYEPSTDKFGAPDTVYASEVSDLRGYGIEPAFNDSTLIFQRDDQFVVLADDDGWREVSSTQIPDYAHPGEDFVFSINDANVFIGRPLFGSYTGDPVAGRVLNYEFKNGDLTYKATILPYDENGPLSIEGFGISVSAEDGVLSVGSSRENVEASGFEYGSAGAVYVFEKGSEHWHQRARLTSVNPDPSQAFGTTINVKRGNILVGAPNSLGGGTLEVISASVVLTTTEIPFTSTLDAKISIYPNIVTDSQIMQIQIQPESSAPTRVSLFSVDGRELDSRIVHPNTGMTSWVVPSIPAGKYYWCSAAFASCTSVVVLR